MRYLVTARVKPGQAPALARAIDEGTLGRGSIAGDEYLRNMEAARELEDGRVQWVEVCYCATPLAEEREDLGRLFHARQSTGRPRAQPVPRSQRDRGLGLRRLRLLGQTRGAPGNARTAVSGWPRERRIVGLAVDRRQLLELLEPVFHDNQFARLQAAIAPAFFDHEKAFAVGREVVVPRSREARKSDIRGVEHAFRAAPLERLRRLRLYRRNAWPREIEELGSVARPERPLAARRDDLPAAVGDIWKRPHVNLSNFTRVVGDPASIR